MLRIFERWLVFPAPSTKNADWNPQDLEFVDVYFDAEDGTRLHGWYVEHPNPRAVVLFSHGNGEDVPRLADRLRILHNQAQVSVFAWDYRSYGRSQGIPHEDNVITDALAALLKLAELASVSPNEILLMGRSLGGGVAVAIAANHPVRGLVLDRTFSTLTEAAAHNVPWLPVKLIMRNKFDSLARIREYHGPLLQTHGVEDEVVPIEQGRRLFAAAPGEHKKFIEIPDLDHNSHLPESCTQDLIDFLDRLTPKSPTNQNNG